MTAQPDDNKPTIVLVHGAWADAAGFGGAIRALQERGFRTVGFANPLRGLPADADYLADFLRSLTGPIVLVGHSYGGAVISAAATGNEQVKALVYFNGWMPDEGENIQQLLENVEGSLVGPSIRPVAFTGPDGSDGADLYLDPEAFHAAFAADVDRATSGVMAATQRPWNGAAFGAPSGPPAWKAGIPCWYLLGTEDKAIPPALQRFMAEARERDRRGGARLPRLVRVAARGRDTAHPAGHRGHGVGCEWQLRVGPRRASGDTFA